ncbi:MAG: hypothetical protein IJT77_06760 [Clostridia bacterium]|nr:hypothetical protein [Clostridia bacterium]
MRFIMLMCLCLICAMPAVAERGAWLTYWDVDGAIDEVNSHAGKWDELICFEAYFDEDGDLVVPDEDAEILEALAASGAAVYLSLVNDVQQWDGTVVQKSREFLTRNLSTEEAQSRHVDKVLELVDTYHLSGLEIDYENMKKDTQLWSWFVSFISRLSGILSRDGVRLRVVMESGAPKYAEFPEGPEYICMCYNLYGYHSGPGPKADREFLEEIGQNWASIPGEPRMAFATGGFLWDESGTVTKALTETDAAELVSYMGVKPERDEASMALTVRINGKDGGTLWYADGTTLAYWRDVLADMGYHHFDLFRLSGNDPDSLDLFLD